MFTVKPDIHPLECSTLLTDEGILPVATGLLVDQASVCADPQATRLIFLPCCRAATSRGRWMALVEPSPS